MIFKATVSKAVLVIKYESLTRLAHETITCIRFDIFCLQYVYLARESSKIRKRECIVNLCIDRV